MTQTDTQTTPANVDNGVNVEALLGAREALDAAPEAAQFKWRTSCEWVNGTHSRSTISGFFGLGEEQARSKDFTIESDHPEVFAAEDHAATPVEIVLSGLAGCLTAGVAAVAQHRGIQLHSVKATLEGDMDLQGILGIDDDVRNGFGNIRVNFTVDADASEDEIKALVAQSQKRSAVFDIVTNPTNVFVTVN
ncbi:MAG: OsmC family protein [Alphaproteobacteria bacterium]|nr:OsmC family protein [Alphaproteobacteria bacterium]